MKPKKITATKIYVSIPWILACILLYPVLWAVFNEKSLTAIVTLGSMFGACVTAGSYTLRYYLKKAGLENIPKTLLGLIQALIETQRLTPEYEILTKKQLNQAVDNIVTPIINSMQKTYEQIVLEDVTQK